MTPQDIIRAWCASCGMAEPSNGECGALLAELFPALSVGQALGEVPIINGESATAHSMLAALVDIHDDYQNNAPEHRCYVESAWSDCLADARTLLALLPSQPMGAPANAKLLVSAYRIAATLQGEQSLLILELANRFARLAGKSAGGAA